MKESRTKLRTSFAFPLGKLAYKYNIHTQNIIVCNT